MALRVYQAPKPDTYGPAQDIGARLTCHQHDTIMPNPLQNQHIQAAAQEPHPIHLADSTRGMPGTGHIDFRAVVRTLADMGFTGSMSLDCLPARPDMHRFLQGSIDYMKAMERANELEREIAGC